MRSVGCMLLVFFLRVVSEVSVNLLCVAKMLSQIDYCHSSLMMALVFPGDDQHSLLLQDLDMVDSCGCTCCPDR